MNKKKILLVIMSLLLVSAITALGTAAYLKRDTNPLKNTYVVGELFDTEVDGYGFFLKEHEAVKQEDGTYTLSSGLATAVQKYDALPGVNIPKDPFISVVGLNIPVYVFIEVVDDLETGLTCTIAEEWVELEGVVGPKSSGKVYCYNGDKITEDILNAAIIDGNAIVVAPTYTGTSGQTTLDIYGFICQATGFDTALDAFNACFK